MRYLLDTSVFLWSLLTPEKLNREAHSKLADGVNELFLSAASCWEIGLKFAAGKLDIPSPPHVYVPASMADWRIRNLDITQSHTFAACGLPNHHTDPFDRMLVAQAQAENLQLMTGDRMLRKYDVDLLWCGRRG